MSGKFTEDHVEQACLDWLEALDYGVLHGPDISPDGNVPECAAYDSTILIDRFKAGEIFLPSNEDLKSLWKTSIVNNEIILSIISSY